MLCIAAKGSCAISALKQLAESYIYGEEQKVLPSAHLVKSLGSRWFTKRNATLYVDTIFQVSMLYFIPESNMMHKSF